MGIRYAKSIKIGDYLKINLSKSGVSATIGKKGASINIGGKGTYLNLSPAIAGLTGTGMSYRKKITGGYGGLLKKLFNKEQTETDEKIDSSIDTSKIDEYEKELEAQINIHKYADKVLDDKEFKNKIDSIDNDTIKELYELSLKGDEETIESLVGSFMANLELTYPVNANFELEDDILYVDLDLPEIEQLKDEYPVVSKKEIINKKKTQIELKQEYALTVMSLSIYLCAQLLNISSYIKQIIISGFTSQRDSSGDLKDTYLYSIKYLRDEFINTDLSKLDDTYNFILKFENRINYNMSNYTFKEIKPYEIPSIEKANSMIEEVIAGLKELGYKNALIQEILPELNKIELNSTSEYLKEALKLLNEKR